jgi:hypothetical protein
MKRAAIMWNTPAVIGFPHRTSPSRLHYVNYHSCGLAGNDSIPSTAPTSLTRDQWAKPERTDTQAATAQRATHRMQVCQKQSAADAPVQGDRNCNRFPGRPTNNACTCLPACTCVPPPPSFDSSNMQCAWQNQGQSSLEKKRGCFYSDGGAYVYCDRDNGQW